MKKIAPFLSIVLVYAVSLFPGPIPLDTLIKKPQYHSLSMSYDGKYIVGLCCEEDQELLFRYDVKTGEIKKLREQEWHYDIYDYTWISNRHVAYKVATNKIYFRKLVATDMVFVNKERLLQLHWGYIVDGLPKDTNHVLIYRRVNESTSNLVRMNVKKGLYKRLDRRRPSRGRVLWWETDFNGDPRLVCIYNGKDKRRKVYYRKPQEKSWKELGISLKEFEYSIYGFTPDGKGMCLSAYVAATKNTHYDKITGTYKAKLKFAGSSKCKSRGLYVYNFESEEIKEKVFSDSLFDFNGILHYFTNPFLSPEKNYLKGVRFHRDLPATHWFCPKMNKIQSEVDSAIPESDNYICDADTGNTIFLVKSESDIKPKEYYLFYSKTKKLELIFQSKPWIDTKLMCRTRPITFVTRDNITLHGYLTLPKTGIKPFPTVVLLHGGPYARDYWGFDSEVQLLAKSGYAVLQVNYRGSQGFGYQVSYEKRFEYHNMYKDVIDAAKYVIQKGIADPDRMAVMGGSFGGYLSLCCVAFVQDVFKCAISNAGVFSWNKQVWSNFGYSDNYTFDFFKTNFGDTTESFTKYLRRISPLYKAKNIKAKVLLCASYTDWVVSFKQSHKMLQALRFAGNYPEVYFRDKEGHGFRHQENIMEYYKRVLAFLEKHIGKNNNKN